MDTFQRPFRAQRLRSLLAAFFFFGLFASMSASAATYPNQAAALAACQAAIAPTNSYLQSVGSSERYTCQLDTPAPNGVYTGRDTSGDELGHYDFSTDLCTSSAAFSGWIDFGGNSPGVSCKEGCAYTAGDGESGAISDGSNQQRFVGTFEPLGRSCTSSESAASGTPTMGDPPKDPPPSSTAGNPPSGSTAGNPPSGSTSGHPPSGSTAGNPPSGSTSGGHSGNPGSGSSSGGTGGNGGTGGSGGTGGNGGGSNPGSGSSSGNPSSGSTAPKPPSSSSSKGSYSGSSCTAPPTCTGDAVMCGVAQESHQSRCDIEKALVGTTDAPDSGKHTVAEVTNGVPVDLGVMDNIDTSGFSLGSTCPFQSGPIAQIGDQAITEDFGPICQYGPYMKAFILILAAIACGFIMSGHTRSGGII